MGQHEGEKLTYVWNLIEFGILLSNGPLIVKSPFCCWHYRAFKSL